MLQPAATDPEDDAPCVLDTLALIGRFYRGTIRKLHLSPERGKVRNERGREIPFVFQHVDMRGSKRRFEDLRDGLTVGYDVSWTSRGLRVSAIWIPD